MALTSFLERSRVAKKVSAVKERLAQIVSDEFFLSHPDWLDRFGERGRKFCTDDARFHLEFLAGALEAGSPESFADYALWTARMLDARGIPSVCLNENLAQISQQLAGVLSSVEHHEVTEFLARATEAFNQPEAQSEEPAGEGELALTREVFLSAILGGQRQGALNIVNEALRSGRSHVDLYGEVFAKALHQVGSLWESNKITVAQEHMATAITQYAIASVYPSLASSGPCRGQMVVTGVAGEHHQIGANLVADAMEAKGWNVRFLGANVPHSAVLEAVNENSADVLCISTTIVANLPYVSELIQSVRTRLGERAPKIVLGGAAYRLAPDYANKIGAVGPVGDLRSALELLCPEPG